MMKCISCAQMPNKLCVRSFAEGSTETVHICAQALHSFLRAAFARKRTRPKAFPAYPATAAALLAITSY